MGHDTPVAYAQVDPPPPASGPGNNIVGLNIARLHQPRYIWAAANVANANGGSWGYLTILLTREDRDYEMAGHLFQQVLDRCYENRVQPIVRVGTRFDEATGVWDRPNETDPPRWRDLFEQVTFPNRTVWIVPANEPNLGREWGGKVDVPSYVTYLNQFMAAFASSDRFKVVNAPLNLSNPHQLPIMQDAFDFLVEMMALDASIFERLPAWATNSYKVDGFGDGVRFTHRGYELELEVIGRELPVIVTETGWINRRSDEDIARFYAQAYKDWQADHRVIAATPLIWDPDVDDHWMFTLDPAGNVATSNGAYQALRGLPRAAGNPNNSAPFANTPRMSAAAVRSRPLPIFMPDAGASSGTSGVEISRPVSP
ncbi:MAG: hypothetical protein IT306_00725 [Chloroflexi bacterium]|nr:hypothetical protein [Chloroflexota bacterium]